MALYDLTNMPDKSKGNIVASDGSAYTHLTVGADDTVLIADAAQSEGVKWGAVPGTHDAVTVSDSAEIDFTLTGQDITASLITGSVDILKLDAGLQTTLGNADTAFGWGNHASGGYLTDITGEALSTLSDVTITTIASGELLKWNGSAWINNTLAEAGISATGHTHTESDITDLGSYSVVGHTHTESDITDLGSYITDISGSPLSELSDTTITAIASGELLKWNGSAWINNTLAEAGVAATGDLHDAVTFGGTGTYISLAGQVITVDPITESDISDLSHTPEGTAIKSTGETVGKVLQADGDNTSSWVTLAGGGDALVANPLSQFASTTSAQLAGVLSDETGTGVAVFGTSPTFTTDLTTPQIYGGATTSSDLLLTSNNQTWDSDNTGRIRIDDGIVLDYDSKQIDKVFVFPFNLASYNMITSEGTITMEAGASGGGTKAFTAQHTVRHDTALILSSFPTFESQVVLQPTAGVNSTGAYFDGFAAIPKFSPDLSTAVTATIAYMGGYAAQPTAFIKSGSHASAAVVVNDMHGFEAGNLSGLFNAAEDAQTTIDNYRAFWSNDPQSTGSGTVTSAANFAAEDITATNTTMLLLGETSIPSGNYAIYQNTNTDPSQLNGVLDMGSNKITSVSDGTADDDVATVGQSKLVAVYRSEAGQSADSTSVAAIQWDTEDIEDSDYTHDTVTNNSRITVGSTRKYRFTGGINYTGTTANYRLTTEVSIRVNGTTVNGAKYRGGYIRATSGANENTVTFDFILDLTASDYVEILTQRLSTTSGDGTVDSGTTINVVQL